MKKCLEVPEGVQGKFEEELGKFRSCLIEMRGGNAWSMSRENPEEFRR